MEIFLKQRVMNSRVFLPQQAASEPLKSEEKSSRSQSFEAVVSPEVPDLFCGLPSPAKYCGPEVANVGDLIRLWVRAMQKKGLHSRIPVHYRSFVTCWCSKKPGSPITERFQSSVPLYQFCVHSNQRANKACLEKPFPLVSSRIDASEYLLIWIL